MNDKEFEVYKAKKRFYKLREVGFLINDILPNKDDPKREGYINILKGLKELLDEEKRFIESETNKKFTDIFSLFNRYVFEVYSTNEITLAAKLISDFPDFYGTPQELENALSLVKENIKISSNK